MHRHLAAIASSHRRCEECGGTEAVQEIDLVLDLVLQGESQDVDDLRSICGHFVDARRDTLEHLDGFLPETLYDGDIRDPIPGTRGVHQQGPDLSSTNGLTSSPC